jgi:hypothetical protein
LAYIENILAVDTEEDIARIEVIELMNNTNSGIKDARTSLKKNSPFSVYFDAWLETNIRKIVEYNEKNYDLEDNFYFMPQFVDLIVDQLYILPLWTAIIIRKWQNVFPQFEKVTRITNNNVNLGERVHFANVIDTIKQTCVLLHL